MRQHRLQNKGHKNRPRRTLHNTQGKNSTRRHKHCKHICTQHKSRQIYKKILEDFKKEIDSNTLTIGDFNTPLSTMDTSSKQNAIKNIVESNNTLDQMDLTDIYIHIHTYIYTHTYTYVCIYTCTYTCVCLCVYPSIPKKQNTHSFQVHIEYFEK